MTGLRFSVHLVKSETMQTGTAQKSKSIIHLDMDAFYPSVEVLDHSELKGKPVIVGGSRKRGVVSSASYEARKFGVHSAQPMVIAMRRCPEAIVMPVRMARYKEISQQVFDIFLRYTPLVEPLSIDEAFLDVTGSRRLLGRPLEIAKMIKQAVLTETGLTVSAGVAPSKFVAKIASDLEKPDGLTVVTLEGVSAFLEKLPISRMWGAGKVTQESLSRIGVRTFGDLSRIPLKVLENRFGKHALKMHLLSHGIDERAVVPGHEIKSMGHEETFPEDIRDLDAAKKELLALSDKTARRMRRHGVQGKTLTLKVKYSDFVLKTRSKTLLKAIDDGLEIYKIGCCLLEKTDVGRQPVRLLGVSLSQLENAETQGQLSLFGEDPKTQKNQQLNRVLDSVVEKHGKKGIRPARLVDGE